MYGLKGSSKPLELYPKDILGSLFTSNPFIAELALKANFPHPTESLVVISSVLLKFNVHILASSITCKNGFQCMVFFVDYSEMKDRLEDLREELRRNPRVLNVKYRVKALEEKIISMFSTPTFNQGKYNVLALSAEELSLVFEQIKEVYKSGGEALLYHIGKMLGKISGEKYKGKRITERFIVEDLLAFQAFGWGVAKIERMNLDKQVITVKMYNLFESVTVKGRKNKPNCHFTRGYLAGLYSKFFNREIEVIETMCIAREDPYCKFTVRPKQS